MDINRLNSLSGMKNSGKISPDKDTKTEVANDSITMDTPNPADMLGRSMLINKSMPRIVVNPQPTEPIRHPNVEQYNSIIDEILTDNPVENEDMYYSHYRYGRSSDKRVYDKQWELSVSVDQESFKITPEQRANMINYLIQMGKNESELSAMDDKALAKEFHSDWITTQYDSLQRMINDGARDYQFTDDERQSVNEKFSGYFEYFDSKELDYLLDILRDKTCSKEEVLGFDFSKLHSRNVLDIVKNQLKIKRDYKDYKLRPEEYIKEFLLCDDKEFEQKMQRLNSRPYMIDNAKSLYGQCFHELLNSDDRTYRSGIKFLEKYSDEKYDKEEVRDLLTSKLRYESQHEGTFDFAPMSDEEFEQRKSVAIEKLKSKFGDSYHTKRIEKDFFNYEKDSILMLEKLIDYDIFDDKQIRNIWHGVWFDNHFDQQVKMNMLDKLVKDGAKPQDIENILSVTTCKSESFVNFLLKDEEFPNKSIKRVVKIAGYNKDDEKN